MSDDASRTGRDLRHPFREHGFDEDKVAKTAGGEVLFAEPGAEVPGALGPAPKAPPGADHPPAGRRFTPSGAYVTGSPPFPQISARVSLF